MKIYIANFIILMIFSMASQNLWAKLRFENIPKPTITKMKNLRPEYFNNNHTPKTADNIVSYLLKTNLFQNVSIYSEGSDYIVVGSALKKINSISLKGNKTFSENELFEVINLNSGVKFDRKKTIEAAQKLKEFYGNKGYLNSKIEVSFPSRRLNYLNIIFSVSENQPCLIKKIDISTENKKLAKILYDKLDNYENKVLASETLKNIDNTANSYLREKRHRMSELS